jgi:hypothetical protein
VCVRADADDWLTCWPKAGCRCSLGCSRAPGSAAAVGCLGPDLHQPSVHALCPCSAA